MTHRPALTVTNRLLQRHWQSELHFMRELVAIQREASLEVKLHVSREGLRDGLVKFFLQRLPLVRGLGFLACLCKEPALRLLTLLLSLTRELLVVDLGRIRLRSVDLRTRGDAEALVHSPQRNAVDRVGASD